MGRGPRIEYKGATYHVIQRGNNKEFIFREDIDKDYFIKHVMEIIDEMGFKIYGYVLMSNHYHFIIQTLKDPLSKIMHQVNNKYCKYYNYSHTRTGHVFEGRYKGILIEDESYLLSLLRYIHQNPVKAGICSNVEDYYWSSDKFYRANIKSFIDTSFILGMISKNRREAAKAYRSSMQEDDDTDFDNVKIFGTRKDQAPSDILPLEGMEELDRILAGACPNREYFYLIKQSSRKRYLTPFKLSYIKKAVESNYSLQQIGRNIGISQESISAMLRRQMERDGS
jgi:REP element-mobilizing transposase RayT